MSVYLSRKPSLVFLGEPRQWASIELGRNYNLIVDGMEAKTRELLGKCEEKSEHLEINQEIALLIR